jgi:hypothetical protein
MDEIRTHANWRATHKLVHNHRFVGSKGIETLPAYWIWTLEIKAQDTGEYVWCDCCYGCLYCGDCLGCIRKLVFVDGVWREHEMRCAQSPTGWHETNEEPAEIDGDE